MLICICCCIYCVFFVLSVTLPNGMSIDVYSKENSYLMLLNITLHLIYIPMITIQTHKRLRLRALPYGLPLGNNFPYFPESMKYYYNMVIYLVCYIVHVHVGLINLNLWVRKITYQSKLYLLNLISFKHHIHYNFILVEYINFKSRYVIFCSNI